jgi:CelD/BcsL family acetyltransferase involved in cellulose biosynthesis
MTDTKIRIISESNEFESLSEVWDSLLRKSGDNNPIYLTHEWLLTWWKHCGEGKKLNVILIEKEGQPIGIVPLMRTEYRIGLFKIHALETIGSLNCNHIGLIRSGDREEAVSAFLAYLEEELAKGELVLRLTWVPDDCEFLDLLRRCISAPSRNLVMQEKAKTLAPYITLPSTWDEYFRSLSQNRRHTLRRKLRSLEKAHNVEFWDCTGDNLESMLRRFIDLQERRWQSAHVKGVFSDPKMEAFYRDIATQFVKKGWLHFSCLIVDGVVVSAEYAFIYNHKFYCATSARDIDYSKYNVGHLHQMFLIKYAIQRGLREFDFLRGDEPYKFHWTESSRRYINFVIGKKGLCSGLRLKLMLAFLRLHEIKQYSLKEIYYIYLMRRREARQRKEMGVGTPV